MERVEAGSEQVHDPVPRQQQVRRLEAQVGGSHVRPVQPDGSRELAEAGPLGLQFPGEPVERLLAEHAAHLRQDPEDVEPADGSVRHLDGAPAGKAADDRLVAPHDARAGKGNRFKQIAPVANASNPRQIRTHVAAQISDRVTGSTGCLRPMENSLAAAHISIWHCREQLFEPGSLLGGVCF